MSEPVRTREAVARAVRRALAWVGDQPAMLEAVSRPVTAALLAMAECDLCKGQRGANGETGYLVPDADGDLHFISPCPKCHGTGPDQSRVARGLNALEGR